MTGTDVARFTHKQSRSYLNHLVDCPVIFRVSGMVGCTIRINFITILLLIRFIQLQNF